MKNVFVPTANVSAFVTTGNALERAEAGVPGLALVHGKRGLGKTRTALWYAARNNHVYLRAKSVWSPTWMLEELAVELGISPKMSKRELFRQIEAALKVEHRLIIFDESNIPPLGCIELIRDLHDVTENPMLLIGHENIVERLRRLGPFFDRFLYITEFKPLTGKDLGDYCRACAELPVDDQAVEETLELTKGNFRKSIVVLKGAEQRAKLNNGKRIGVEHLRAAK